MINVKTAKSEITDVIETIEKWIPMFEQGNAPAVLVDVMELLDSQQAKIERLKEQEAMNVDSFVQWCIDNHIAGDATVQGIKYWVGKFKEGR